MPWYLGNNRDFFVGHWWGAGLLVPLAIWSLFWSGLALWYAARRGEKWWFIIFLLIHTAGILEIIYLLFWAKCCGPWQTSKANRRK